MEPFLIGGLDFIAGVVVTAIVMFILKKNEPEKLEAFLDLDWDRDGETGEIYAKLKKTHGDLVEKIKSEIARHKK